MLISEVLYSPLPYLLEGGNVSSKSPGWKGADDQTAEEIDLKLHNRDFMVKQLRKLFAAQNKSFREATGKYIWSPSLLASGEMFSGSSVHFFNIQKINTDDFLNKLKKTKVGDIDTQVDQTLGDDLATWLESIIGQKVGNGVLLGFNSSLSSIWLLDDPVVRVQVDYELGPYDAKTKKPTDWFAYSHSSHYDDMEVGIKGVFHKYINRALVQAHQTKKYVAKVQKRGVKISDEPIVDSNYSFAVTSAQGGGLSLKYRPYLDPQTGEPAIKNKIPIMQYIDTTDRHYVQNLDQQFELMFGSRRTEADKKLQGSFVGTIQLMNKYLKPEQNRDIVEAFYDILFGAMAQMITKNDPQRDRDAKFAAIDLMLLGTKDHKPLKLPNATQLRQQAVNMAIDYERKFRSRQKEKGIIQEAQDTPSFARKGVPHIYSRLPDGRASSAEMKDSDFIKLSKEIAQLGGSFDKVPINLKVDGAGIRFGRDQKGQAFFMTSRVDRPIYAEDQGFFSKYAKEQGQNQEQQARARNYDQALKIITDSDFIKKVPVNTLVQAEMLYTPMAQQTDDGLQFVNISYNPQNLGKLITLVPFSFKKFSTGTELPAQQSSEIKKQLTDASTSDVKIINNQLEHSGLDVMNIIEPVVALDPKNRVANKDTLDAAREKLSQAILTSPKLKGKNVLGNTMEGIIVNMPSGQVFKVTSPQMKQAMADKATPASKQKPKTAVVAIGSFVGHKGHQELWRLTKEQAQQLGADPYLFIGNAVGVDDPIPPSVKIQTWHRLDPEYARNISAAQQGGSLMQKIKHELVNPRPGHSPRYDNVVIMVGEDQRDMPLAQAVMKAVNKFPGYEHVKVTLNPTPRTTGISFTKLRNILKDPQASENQQYQLWSQGFDETTLGRDWIKHLMDITRRGMGLNDKPQRNENRSIFQEVTMKAGQ